MIPFVHTANNVLPKLYSSMLQKLKQVIFSLGQEQTGLPLWDSLRLPVADNPLLVQLHQLEERVLYSASPIDLPQEPSIQIDAEVSFDAAADFLDGHQFDSLVPFSGQSSYLTLDEFAPVNELIIVDQNVDNYQELVNGIVTASDRDFEIVFLQDNLDGIEQITELLEGYSNLDAIHLVSHGEPGALQVANSQLTLESITGYTSDLARWSLALNQDADLLIYGCELAGTEHGETLVEAISAITQADVAASDNLTGHANLGGDWSLEYATGQIESDVIFGQQVQQAWFSLLTVTADNDSYSTGENTVLNESAPGVLDNDDEGVAAIPTVTTGALLNYDASLDTNADNIWEESNGSTFDWTLDPGVTYDNSLIGAPPGITSGFVFDGFSGGFISPTFDSFGDNPTDATATFEIWFRPESPSDRRGVLFETGDTNNGTNIRLYQDSGDAFVEFVVIDEGGLNFTVVTANITTEMNSGNFIQIAATFDATVGTAELFVNGVSVGSDSNVAVSDWADGPSGSAIGNNDGSFKLFNDPHFDPFEGEIGIFRIYDSVLTTTEIQNNYDAITTAPIGGGGLTVTSFDATSAAGATVNVNSDGSFTYDPGTLFDYLKDGEWAIDTFDYTAEDGSSNTDTATVSITINGVNEAPTDITLSNLSLDEHIDSTVGYSVGTLSATDEDSGENFMYFVIGGADASLFSIGGGGNELILTTPKRLDFETQSSYEVVVQVEDSGGNKYNETITIGINNLVEPTANAGTSYVMYEGESLDVNGTLSTDDGTVVQYLWDLNNDLTYGDVSTATASIDWSDLVTLWGIDDGSVTGEDYTIGLQVVDNQGGTDETTATVTVFDTAPDLTTTGTGSVVAGSSYTLNLSSFDHGDDTILDWIVDWGDGTIDSPGSNASTWYHTYQVAGNYDITVAAIDEDGTHLQNSLLVSGYNSSQTYTFDANTGGLLDSFDAGGQDLQIEVGPNGNLFVTSFGSTVQQFDANGTPLGVFTVGGSLNGADGLVFGPDGNLYVTSFYMDVVQRFDGITGQYIDDFTVGGTLDGPSNLTFGPDGNLYVSSWNSNEILIFDGRTGVYIDVFASGLSEPETLAFSPDGNLYVANRANDEVLVFDGTTRTVLDSLSDPSLVDPYGLAFGPNDMLYVSGFVSDNVVIFDVDSGDYQGELVNSSPSGLDDPAALHFMPGEQVTVTAAAGISDAIWLATQDDVTSSGTDGATNWTDGTILQLSGPDFALEDLGTTDGAFSAVVNLDDLLDSFVGDGNVEIQGMHYVTSDIRIGGVDSVQLYAGDVLLSVNDTEAFNGTGLNFLWVENTDIFVYRPDTVGDYSSGTFHMLMDNPTGSQIQAFTLVEQDTLVGDTIVRAGDFLFVEGGVQNDDIQWFRTTGAGWLGDTSGLTPVNLVAGDDFGYGTRQIVGLDLVENSMTVGGHNLVAGQIIQTVNGDLSLPGASVNEFDVFTLTLSATTYGSPSAAGTAALLLEGAEIQLADPAIEEDIHALTLIASAVDTPPTDISPDTLNIVEGTDASGGINLATLMASDTGGGPFTYAIVGGADAGNFTLINDDELIFTFAGVLNHEGQDSFFVDIEATDPGANSYVETIVVNVDDINEAPTVGNQTFVIDEGLSNGNVVGNIFADDVDDGVNGDFSFSVTGASSLTAFNVDASGQITVANADELDFELTPSFTIDVEVTDNGTPGLSDTATITIDLNDIQNFLVVNTFSDDVDGDVDSIGELLADMGTDGVISLREAILATNNTVNDIGLLDEIQFGILGGGVQTIVMTGPRMEITDAVYLNATTQSGYTYDTPMIEIDGSGITGAEHDIFWITGGGTTVQGFVLNNAGDDAIDIEFGDGNTIIGNFIGTDSTGTAAAGNDWGIAIKSNNNVIGGSTDAERNIISASTYDGIIIHESNDNGGYFPATGNQILGNLIGVDLNGDALGNGRHGILLREDASGTQIGGQLLNQGNIIANNSGDGVALDGAGVQNSILGNLIFGNDELGIDIDEDGITPNSTTGPGPNNYQNFPDLTSATTDGAALVTVDGSLTAEISSDYRIEFFATSTGDLSTHGQAEIFLGYMDVTTDPTGTVSFSTDFSAAVPVGYEITATATDNLGNTSEFSQNVVTTSSNLSPTAITPNAFSIDENTDTSTGYNFGVLTAADPNPSDTFTFEVLTGLDADKFSLAGTNLDELVLTAGILDFEDLDEYYVMIRVEDSAGNQHDELITVSVDDLPEAPTAITPTSFNVDENTNTLTGFSLGSLSAVDDDAGDTFIYSIEGGADEFSFSIGGTGSDELIISDGILDHELQDTYYVLVRVEDSAGYQHDELITVTVDDLNEAPTGITPTSVNIDENINTTGGYSLGLMTATDDDDGDSFTYSVVGGTDAGHFSISGNELFITDGTVDHESQDSYTVDIEVEDAAGDTFIETIIVGINDQNDDPEILTSTMSVLEGQNIVGMVAADDQDVPNDTLTFSIAGTGDDDGHFLINGSTGLLGFIVAPNFESPGDDNGDNIYDVDVMVSDGEGGNVVKTLSVSVDDNNERPTATLLPILRVNEDAANQVVNLHLIFEDAEDADNALTYSVENVNNPTLFDGVSISPSDRLVLDFAADQNGSALITVRATDSGGQYVETTIRVTIRPVNDDPFVSNPIGNVTVDEDASNSLFDLSNVFDDVDIVTNGDSLSYAVTSNSNTTLVDVGINAKGFLVLDYQDDQFGTSTIVVTATDEAGKSVSETINVTVNPVQDATVVVDDRFRAVGSDPIIIDPASILKNDIDVDSTVLTAVPVTGSEIGGTLSIDGGGNLVFTPDGKTAIASFQYVVVADGETSLPGTVTINVAGGSSGLGGEDPPEEEEENEDPGTNDPPVDPPSDPPTDPGVIPENGTEDPGGSGNEPNSNSADNLADTVNNEASSLDFQGDGVDLGSGGSRTTYAYADNQQLGELVFQFSTGNLIDKVMLSTFDPTFIANVFWDELDNANREFMVNNLNIGIPKMVASTASFLTVGYLAWIIRGGVLMTTVMTSLPAWRSLDIVPIIESANQAEEDGESIEQMVDN